jgi:hypothetical protein
VRVSAERVFELARYLTERDREIVCVLFEQQLLTTDQLALVQSWYKLERGAEFPTMKKTPLPGPFA